MTPRSSTVRRRPAGGRWSAVAIVLAALVGAWFSHLVEYGRVAGVDAGLRSIGTSVHIYLLPAGLGLLAAVAAAGALAALAWSRLARRLADARRLMRARRNGRAGQLRAPAELPWLPRLTSLWLVLLVLQLAIWVVQENVELSTAGLPTPGFGVLGGAHVLAPAVHAGVALGLAALIVAVHQRFDRRVRQVRAQERLLVRRWPAAVVRIPVALDRRSATPLERWGRQRWQRPPPAYGSA